MDFLKYIAKTSRINQHPLGEKGTIILHNSISKKANQILELGCGSGHTASIISNNKIKYYGVDSSKEMIYSANKRKKTINLNNVTFLLTTNSKLPFPNNFFDLVFCESVLAILTFEESVKYLIEIYRVLKKDGQFIANESLWNNTTSKEDINRINKLTNAKFNLVQASNKMKLKILLKSINEAGFKNIKSTLLENIFAEDNKLSKNKSYLKSIKYSKKEKIKSLLNPFRLYQYIYFKINELKCLENGKFISSYLIVCKK